jgi:hypothetical protein
MFFLQKSIFKGTNGDHGKDEALDNEDDSRKKDRQKDDKTKKAKVLSIQNPISILKERRQKKLADRQKSNGEDFLSPVHDKSFDMASPSPIRQPFSASGMITSKRAALQQREILVPYSRFRRERFFDWPPDPLVAQAVPIQLNDCNSNNDSSMNQQIKNPMPVELKRD